MADIQDDVSDDDKPVEDDDPLCLTILLTSAEKKALPEPWRKRWLSECLIKGIGYLQLKRRLRAKWTLKGDRISPWLI